MKPSQNIGSVWVNVKFSIKVFVFICFESKNNTYSSWKQECKRRILDLQNYAVT